MQQKKIPMDSLPVDILSYILSKALFMDSSHSGDLASVNRSFAIAFTSPIIFSCLDMSRVIFGWYMNRDSDRFTILRDSEHPIAVLTHGVIQYFKYGNFEKGLQCIRIASARGIPVAKYLYAILCSTKGPDSLNHSISYIQTLKGEVGATWPESIQKLRSEADHIIGMVIERWPGPFTVSFEHVDIVLQRRCCGSCVAKILAAPPIDRWAMRYYAIDDPRLCDECVVDEEYRLLVAIVIGFE